MAAPESINSFRAYSKPFDTNKGVQSFTQIYDSGYVWENGSNVVQTGAWRPLFASDFAAPNISISGVTIAVDQLESIGTSGVAYQAALSGQVDQINNKLETLVTETSSKWQKVSSSGYVQAFAPITGRCLVNKINGYSKCPQNTNFIQIFDATSQAGTPEANLAVMSGNNFFYEFSDEGVEFANGLAVANSFDPVAVQTGSADFFVTIVYKML
jgi:hypothetical protein